MKNDKPLGIDEALECAGSWGLYQKLLYALVFVAGIPNAFVALHFIFSHYEPPHHCNFPDELANYTNNNTKDLDAIIRTVIPQKIDENGNVGLDGCRMYKRNYSIYPADDWPRVFNYTTEARGCTEGMFFDLEPYQNSAALEFSMICDNGWKSPLSVSVYHVGLAVGSLCGGIADRYGRRPTFLINCLLQVVSMMFCAAAWNFPSYCAGIFVTGLSGILNYIIPFVLVSEVVGKEHRNFIVVGLAYSFAIGYCIIAGIAYLIQEWRWFIGTMTIISAVIYIPAYWLCPESARWLAQKGRSKEAVKSLKLIAKINGNKDNFRELLETRGEEIVLKEKVTSTGVMESLRVLFKSGIAGRFWASALCWFVSSMMYYGISYYSTDFSSDRFLNVFLGGITEFPGLILGFYFLKIIGRPRTLFLLMFICGVTCIVLPFIPKDLPALITAIALVGKAAIAGVFHASYLVTPEVIPTRQRSSAVGLCSAGSRIGSFSASYLMYIRKFKYYVPNLILGSFALVCALVSIIFLPETKGVELPDTAEEVRNNNRFYGWNLCRNFDRDKTAKYKIGRKSPVESKDGA